MNLDYGRQQDLLVLAEGIKNAKSRAEREHYEKIAYRIMNESTKIRSMRDELIRAFRVKDIAKVKRLQDHMHAIRLEETGGASWGQNKAERKLVD